MKTITVQLTKCAVCGKDGKVSPVERLPDGGVLMKAVHGTKKRAHIWSEHPSLFIARKNRNPTKIKCPKCGKTGRVNSFVNSTNPYKIKYYVAHQKISGTWGEKKMHKYKRCYIYDPAMRDIILKKLGRFITSS